MTTRPYADISRLSHFPEESEVLFAIGTEFEIIGMNFTENVWTVELRLNGTSFKYNEDLNRLTARKCCIFQGSALPLIYESLAEIMFPLPESLSVSILVQLNNITALILLFIPPYLYKLMNFFVIVSIGARILMMLSVNINYKRRNEDERKQ